MKALLKKRVIIPALAVGILLTTSAFKNDFFEIAKQIEIFTTLFKELNMNYVDETNPAELMDTAIKSMLNDLDPYTKFHNEQDVEAYKINQSGEYSGIGASINRKEGKLFITEPFKDYPADKAGLKAGDEIIQVGGITVANFKEDTSTLLKGAPNTKIAIKYLRQGKQYTTQLTRSAIAVKAVPFYKMMDENTGYIVLKKFNNKAYAETKQALVDLKAQGATQIILDLRGNPGGLLRESIRIVNLFVPKGELIVTTKSKVKKYNKTYTTQEEPLDTQMPLVVLVNGRSASASEIVSGALQDLDRAVIIGSRSFGKGLVQRPKPLTYGTQLKVTISRYHTPSGRCIQAIDYTNGKAIKTKEKDFNAFTTKGGRTVYDGGGIEPDVKIANENLNSITKALLRERILFNYCVDYFYNNPTATLSNFKFNDADYQKFKDYVIASNFEYRTYSEKIVDQLKTQAEKDKLLLTKEIDLLEKSISSEKNNALETNKAELKELITHQLITQYFYKEGLYQYQIQNNEAILKANRILTDGSYKSILE